MDYKNSTEVCFTVLSGGGSICYAELHDKMSFFGNGGFEGISGRAKYVGGGAQHRGTGSLGMMVFNVEYDSDDDLKAIKRELRNALDTEHSGAL